MSHVQKQTTVATAFNITVIVYIQLTRYAAPMAELVCGSPSKLRPSESLDLRYYFPLSKLLNRLCLRLTYSTSLKIVGYSVFAE